MGCPDVNSGDEIADPIGIGDVEGYRIGGAARIPDLWATESICSAVRAMRLSDGTVMAAGDSERATDAAARASYQYVGVGQGRGTHRERTARFWVRVWTWLVLRPRY